MRTAVVVSDFPILSGSVSRKLDSEYRVRAISWNEFVEQRDGLEPDLLVVDSTTLGETVALELGRGRWASSLIAVTSLHTNEIRLFGDDRVTAVGQRLSALLRL